MNKDQWNSTWLVKSKTIWGLIMTMVALALSVFGVELNPEDQTTITDKGLMLLEVLFGLLGPILVVIGRFNATKPLRVAPVVALCCVMIGAPGCSGLTPMQQTMIARQTYVSTLNFLSAARTAGEIDDDTYRSIDMARQQAAAALDGMETAAVTEDASFASYLSIANAAIDELIRWRAQLEGND